MDASTDRFMIVVCMSL